ncbi:PepSY domain-containing protein [Methylibium sp.]|uniref:PepSY-associated TM helix domain-containing protein n=1 Tax=Methylibium sp. TaxID=2067992 RepID=UPI0017A41D0D|nr:PepSY-associated TM helix domain-containing protein [Methylibium sp.]MBA3590390.1 PepSY domain-containing protein [Methylibium sp.]
MTSRRTLSILYTLHSWAGIVTGLLMFVVCFSGAVVVFKHEIDLWANPGLEALPRVASPVGPDAVLASLAERHPGVRPESLLAPDDTSPVWFVSAKAGPGEPRVKLAARADTGEIVGPVDSERGQFIRTLHVFLFFGPRWIVGFLGVAMFFLIVSGTVIHRKVLKELFTLRWGRSFRLIASDFHKAAGVWGLLFHGVIAFTGAWLGLAPVFERAYEHLLPSGQAAVSVARTGMAAGSALHPELEAMLAASAGAAVPPRAAASGGRAAVPVDALMHQAARDVPGFLPRRVSLRGGEGDGGRASVAFTGPLRDSLYANASVRYDAATGALLEKRDPRQRGFWSQFNGLMEPLHFGDFGGLVLKWLYFLLGLTPAALSLSGTLIWIDRRKHRRVSRTASAAQQSGPAQQAGPAAPRPVAARQPGPAATQPAVFGAASDPADGRWTRV